MNMQSQRKHLEPVWRLRPGFTAQARNHGGGQLFRPNGSVLEIADPVLFALIEKLVLGASESELLAGQETADHARVLFRLRRLIDHGMVELVLLADGRAVAVAEPCRPGFDYPASQLPSTKLRLDRFSHLRPAERGLTLAHPEASCEIVLADPGLAGLIAGLTGDHAVTEKKTDPVEQEFVAFLAGLGFLKSCDEAEDSARRSWEFHDALFHHASRAYGDWRVRGGSYRLSDCMPAPSAFRQPYRGETIVLPQPGDFALHPSKPLAAAMERRRSIRAMAARPVGLPELSAVLHRTARLRSGLARGEEGQDCFRRPVPSGGSIHEIEIYLALREGNALDEGLYHYRGDHHALTRIEGAEEGAKAMLLQCARSWRQKLPPPVLAVLATRFPRIAWKYENIAYHLTLINAGVLIQSLYLVTADLGLAGCAAGLGDNAAFLRATGNRWHEETNIAEFGFGWPAEDTA